MFGRRKNKNSREKLPGREKKNIRQRFRELKERNRMVRVLTNIYVLTFVVFFVWITFIDGQSLLTMFSNYMEIKKQEQMIYKYHKSIEETDGRLRELTSNKDSLERFARERFHYHEKDEDVYLLVD